MTDQSRLVALSESPAGDTIRSAGSFRSFAKGGKVLPNKVTAPVSRINRSNNVPWLAGASSTPSGYPVNIDLRVPKTITVKGKTFSPDKYLAVHEIVEYGHMRKGMRYQPAHRLALRAERAALEADGFDWNGYQEVMHQLAQHIEKAPHPNPPRNLYIKEYPAREKDDLEQQGVHYCEGGPVKGYAAGGPVTDTPLDLEASYQQQYGGEDQQPLDLEQAYQQQHGPDTTATEAFVEHAALGALPTAGAVPGAIVGAGAGAALGALGGPLAPITEPIATLGGGLAGAMLGSEAVSRAQDYVLDKLGLVDRQRQAQQEQEHPYASFAGGLAPGLAAFQPGAVARSAERLLPAAVFGGQEAAQEATSDEGFDPTKIAMATAAGALMTKPTKLGESLIKAGESLNVRMPWAKAEAGQAGRPDMKPPDTEGKEGSADQAVTNPLDLQAEELRQYGQQGQQAETPPLTAAVSPEALKTPEAIEADKKAASPEIPATSPTMSIAAERPMPKDAKITYDPAVEATRDETPIPGYTADRSDRQGFKEDVSTPTTPGPMQAEVVDPAKGGVGQDVLSAIMKAPEITDTGESINPVNTGERINFQSAGARRVRPEPPAPLPERAPAREGMTPDMEAQYRDWRRGGAAGPPDNRTLWAPQFEERLRQELGAQKPAPEPRNTGPLHAEIAHWRPEIEEAYQRGYKNWRTEEGRTGREDEKAAWDRGAEDATNAAKPAEKATEKTFKGRRVLEPAEAPEERPFPDLERRPPSKGDLYEVPPEEDFKDNGIAQAVHTDNLRWLVEKGLDNTAIAEHYLADPKKYGPMIQNIRENPSPKNLRAVNDYLKTQKAEKVAEKVKAARPVIEGTEGKQGGDKTDTEIKGEALKLARQVSQDNEPTRDTVSTKPDQFTETHQRAQRIVQQYDTAYNAMVKRVLDKNEGLRKRPADWRQKKNIRHLTQYKTPASDDQRFIAAARRLANMKTASPRRVREFETNEKLYRAGAPEFKQNIEAEIARKRTPDTEIPDTENKPGALGSAWKEFSGKLSEEDKQLLRDQELHTEVINEQSPEESTETFADHLGIDDDRPTLTETKEQVDDAVRRFFDDEHGSIDITGLVRMVNKVFGKRNAARAKSYIAREATSASQEEARSLDEGLFGIKQANVETRVHWLKTMDRVWDKDFKEDEKAQERIYLARENGKINDLSAKDQSNYNKYLKPIFDMNDQIFGMIKNLNKDFGEKVENHIYRIAKGLHPDYGGDPIQGVQPIHGLSRTASMLKARTFYALEDAKGNRTVVSNNPETVGYSEWHNGTATNRPSADWEPKVGTTFTDHAGVQQKVVKALTPEIEAHARFANGAKAEYYHNAALSAVETNTYLMDVLRNTQYLESLKQRPEFLQYATDNSEIAKKNGWEESKFPQMKGWYMANQLRYVFNDFSSPGFTPNAIQDLARAVTKTIFWNPVPHVMNGGGHWFAQRGFRWINPESWGRLASTSMKAIESVIQQNGIQSEIRLNRGGTVYGSVLSNNFLHEMGSRLGVAIRSNPSKWDPIARVLGVSTMDLGRAVYRNASEILWAANDVMYTQAYLERRAEGSTIRDAIVKTEQHYPNYRIPTTIMGSGKGARIFSQIVQDPALLTFGRYHWAVFNSYAHSIKDLVHGTPEERLDSIGKLMALGFLAFAIYPVLDRAARYVTGNQDASATRRGPLAIPAHVAKALSGTEDIGNTLRSSMTLSPLLATGLEAYNNRDFAGRTIREPGDVQEMAQNPTLGGKLAAAGRVAVQQGEHAARGLVAPYGTFTQAMSPGRSIPQTLRDQLLDIKNPSERAIKFERGEARKNLEAAIARQKKGGRGPAEEFLNYMTR